MAKLTLDPSSIEHVLPSQFWGCGHSTYKAHTVEPVSAYRSLLYGLGMEVFRIHNWGEGTSGTDTTALKNMALDLYGNDPTIKVIAQLSFRNSAWLGATYNPMTSYPTRIQSGSGTNGSPEAFAATIAAWLTAGVPIQWIEPYNEPANNYGSNGERWFAASGVSGYSDGASAARDWVNAYQREFYQGLHNNGISTAIKIAGLVIGGAAKDYIWTETLRFLEPVGTITSFPRSDGNYGYLDVVSAHPYPNRSSGADTSQSAYNSLVYKPGTADVRAGMTAWADDLRSHMDGLGHSDKGILFTECAAFNAGSLGGLMDTLYAIACSRNASRWGLQAFIYHAVDNTNADNIINDNGGTDSTFQRTYRYRTLQQLVGPFIHNYKHQLFSNDTLAWTTTPGNTPGGTDSNAVPRLQIAAGLNAAGNTIGVLVANIDLGTGESLEIDLPAGLSLSAPANYLRLPAGQSFVAGSDVASLTGGTLGLANDTSITRTIAAGEAYLIEIPITPVSVLSAIESIGSVLT